MYKLENNIEWTTDLKNAFKHNATRAKLLWSGTEINESNNLCDLTLDEQRYISNLGFIGSATARKLEINLIDSTGDINLENKEVVLKIGADYDGDTYYINYGNFIVDKSPEIDATNGKMRVVAYDYMIKFNKPYVNRVSYPCSLLRLLQDVCNQAEVELGSEEFANKDFSVQDNQFEGATLREVLQNIAKCAFSWARIGQDNKLYLDFNLLPDATETITIDDYKTDSFKKANDYYGPINQVTYADSDIQGQEEKVPQNPIADEIKELVIYDNLFAYTPATRRQLIQAGTKILGLKYMPISELELIGLAYLDCCDIINIETLDNTTFESRVFNHQIHYTGILSDSIVTEGTSNNEEVYKNTAADVFQNQQTRIIVDRANKKIESVVEEVGEQNNKLSEMTQTIDEIRSQISDIADLTTSQETTNAKLQFEGIGESEPINIRIRPSGSNISLLYPNSGMFPSPTLFMKTRILRFTNINKYVQTEDRKYKSYKRYYSYDGTDYTLLNAGIDYIIGNTIIGTKYENVYIDYELPMNLLWYDIDNYDEFVLDYDSQICQVKKKVQYNSDGTTSLLQQETVYNFSYPHIYLDEGDYEIELLGYAGAYMFIRLMVKNIYGAQWATKAELNSAMSQTKEEISAEVIQTLSGYSTTEQMQSAINIKAGEINSQVMQTYETKSESNTKYSNINQNISEVSIEVGEKYNTRDFTNAKITAAINDGTSNVKINADKVSLAGKTIDLTSENININSNCFKVDKNGNTTIIDYSGTDGNFQIKTPNNNFIAAGYPYGTIYKGPNGYVEIQADFTYSGGSILVAPSSSETSYGSNYTLIQNGNVNALTVTQRSKESIKKNIKLYNGNALELIKNSEIYEYNYKNEKDGEKKHIGFVIPDIGGNYKTPKEVISANKEGIEQYNMTSILWKAVQDQQKIIDELQTEIRNMKGEKNG